MVRITMQDGGVIDLELDAIVEKAMTEPAGGKVKQVDVKPVTLRQADEINLHGAQRILV